MDLADPQDSCAFLTKLHCQYQDVTSDNCNQENSSENQIDQTTDPFKADFSATHNDIPKKAATASTGRKGRPQRYIQRQLLLPFSRFTGIVPFFPLMPVLSTWGRSLKNLPQTFCMGQIIGELINSPMQGSKTAKIKATI